MDIADFSSEKKYKEKNLIVIGIDEAGRGPLAGPVVAAACVLKDGGDLDDVVREGEPLWNFVRDSKTVSEKKRDAVFAFVQEKFYVGVGVAAPDVIDRLNILQATFLAMKSAVSDLERNLRTAGITADTIILLDGNQLIPNISREQVCVTSGDSKVKSIAAASIIAKVTRDKKMLDYDSMFPAYGFAAHKGYGTKVHMEALRQYGASPIHRKSFGPVKRVTHSVQRPT